MNIVEPKSLNEQVYYGPENRDYNKLITEYSEFELPKEIKHAFKNGMSAMFGGSLNRAKIRMFHIEHRMNEEDVSYIMGLPPERREDEKYDLYRTRREMAAILYKDRVYLNNLSSTRPEIKEL